MKKATLTAAAILAACPAWAQNADPALLIREQFAKIDTNGDGEISQEEFWLISRKKPKSDCQKSLKS